MSDNAREREQSLPAPVPTRYLATFLLLELGGCCGVTAMMLAVADRWPTGVVKTLAVIVTMNAIGLCLVMNGTSIFRAAKMIFREEADRAFAAIAMPATILQTGALAFLCLYQDAGVNAIAAGVALIAAAIAWTLWPKRSS